MAKLYPLQYTFASGAITPRMHLASPTDIYKQGCTKLENFVPVSHGPIVRRSGTNFNAALAGTFGRIFPFTVSQSIGFIVTLTSDGNLFVNDQSGTVIDNADNLLLNGDFIDSGDDWTVVAPGGATVFFTLGACALLPSPSQDAAIQQELTTPNPGSLHLLAMTFANGNSHARVKIGTAVGLGDIVDQDLNGVRSFDIGFTPGVSPIFFEVVGEAGNVDSIVNKIQILDLTTAPTEIEFSTPFDENDIIDMQWDMPAGSYVMYLVTGKKTAHKLTLALSTRSWTFETVAFTAPPAEWANGSFPSAICFFQGRMWLGGPPDDPEKFWGSKSGSFEDFTLSDGTSDDDALEFEMDDRGKIEWMAGTKNLLIGTETRENIITSAAGLITASDVQVEVQSAYGSRNVQAISIGNRVLYVSPDGRKIRDTSFEWQADLYTSRDLTFYSEHITEGQDRVEEIHWMQNPDNLLWGVTIAGNLICATYEREKNVIGWSTHNTDGVIVSAAVIESFGASQLWLLVRRDVPGHENELYLELSDPGDYSDSHTTLTFVTPQTAISVPHLSLKTVTILTDGAVHPDITLDANGDGELNYPATKVLVGLRYKSMFESLPISMTTREGSTKQALKRWNKLWVSLLTSTRPIINGQRPADRTPSTPMNTAEPPGTEYVKVTDLGLDRDAIVTIEEDLPVPTQINGIFGELSSDNL